MQDGCAERCQCYGERKGETNQLGATRGDVTARMQERIHSRKWQQQRNPQLSRNQPVRFRPESLQVQCR